LVWSIKKVWLVWFGWSMSSVKTLLRCCDIKVLTER
jgi:hypothetical protein